MFDFEEERLKTEINKRCAKRVLIQLPEGLKAQGSRLAEVVEKTGALAIVSADPCYGACDLALNDAESLGVDLIIHYGHSEMLSQNRVSTLYLEARARVNVKGAIKEAIPLLKGWRNIGLVTTVQHVQTLVLARNLLNRIGKNVVMGKPNGHIRYAGQVIGCDYGSAKAISREVDGFLFIGGGRFHAIGVALATTKPVVVADPFEKRSHSINSDVKRIIKQRWANISEAKNQINFGVIIGLKTGQKWLNEAIEIKETLEERGKKATLIALREITSKALMQFLYIDAFISTACPCLVLFDSPHYLKPVLTPKEALVMLGKIGWEELISNGWF